MATESDMASRAIRLLYEAAVGTDAGWVHDLVVLHDMKSRERNEEVALAYAAVLWRTSGGAAPQPADDVVKSPDLKLSAADILRVAGALLCAPPQRAVLLRVFSHAVCGAAAQSRLTWNETGYQPDASARARFVRLLSAFGARCNFTSYGDGYVERRLRLLLPSWSVCTTAHGRAPHRVTAEQLTHANDVVRPVLDINIPTYLKNWSGKSVPTMCAVVACVQEITGGIPACHLNQEVLRCAKPAVPSIAYMTEDFYGEPKLGVWVGANSLDTSQAWSMGAVDCLLEWMVAARDMGVEQARDLCDAVLDNCSDSPVHSYISGA
ncbi:MAG: hypothetical protein ACPGR8_10335 [Limisphaerales bacterium]